MAIPPITKLWQFRPNVVVLGGTTALETSQKTLWTMKEEMVNFFGWSVALSCDAVTVAPSDLWTDFSKLIWQFTQVHSWVVLSRPWGTGQLLIECKAGNFYHYEAYVYYSPGGLFTGGSTLLRPTAPDEFILVNDVNFLTLSSTVSRVLHIMQTVDGSCFRLFHLASTNLYTSILIDALDSPHPSCTGEIVSVHGDANHLTTANYLKSAANIRALRTDLTILTVTYTCAGTLNGPLNDVWTVPDPDGSVPMLPLRAFATNATHKTRLGFVPDIWGGPTAFATNGDTYSDAIGNPRKFVQFNHFIFPWDGVTAPEVA